ncbi:MAG: YdcF family protein [Nostoc sp. LLA-1]|nr:YdcF family protein [Cyanocohniella sp. LLY]
MWTTTAQGWLIFLVIIAVAIFYIITHLYSFLAVTAPIKSADALVIEGWISDKAIAQAYTELKNGSYKYIITIGSSVEQGSYLIEYKNFAEIAAATLNKMGVPKEDLVVVPSQAVVKERTNASAISLLQWLSQANLPITSINLLTCDAHARRSWMIFKHRLAPQIQVGIIATEPANFDPKKWWNSSEGARVILSETIAYIYAQFVNWES